MVKTINEKVPYASSHSQANNFTKFKNQKKMKYVYPSFLIATHHQKQKPQIKKEKGIYTTANLASDLKQHPDTRSPKNSHLETKIKSATEQLIEDNLKGK